LLQFSYVFLSFSSSTEHIDISLYEKGVAAMGNLSLKSEHHGKLLPKVQVPLFSIPERTLYWYCLTSAHCTAIKGTITVGN